jgi:Ser/Thr protein kinase RdoA (MazF antagonist)
MESMMLTPENPHPYDALTPDCVLNAVESVGYRSDARILALNSYENRVYQVGLEEGAPLIAKFYRPERWTTDQIIEEHRFLLSLSDIDIPVVPPLADAHGQTLHQHQNFLFTLFPRQGGHAPELDNLDNLYILGRTLGRIHALGAVKAFTHRPSVDVESYARQSQAFLLNERFIPTQHAYEYQRLTEALIEQIERRFQEQDSLTSIRLHGDCHVGNILWRDNAPHFVDFDDCRMGPAVQDLWMMLSGDQQQQRLQLSEILEGYEEFHEFNREELSLIEPLRALRLMHYCAWLAKRWSDPAFPISFTWFNTDAYWMEHLMELQGQLSLINQPPLTLNPR